MQAFSDSLSASEMRTAMGLDEINPEVWRNLVEFDNLAEAIYMGRETSSLTIQDFLSTFISTVLSTFTQTRPHSG
ncbi:MAG: hypothetical protein IJE07_04240, partial [Clostridia bacterium]|nr:hypothetical protein [Clostridia bacterium]